MRGFLFSTFCASALLASTEIAPAQAAVSADINIHVGRRAPAVYFAREPRVVLIPDTEVYCVQDVGYDYDMFRCGDWWYIDDGGYWYRSRSYRGPFVTVSFTSLPWAFRRVPSGFRHQPFRPGQWNWSENRNEGRYQRNNDGRSYQGNQYPYRRDDNRRDGSWQNSDRNDGNGRGDRNDGDQRWRDDNRGDKDQTWQNGRGPGNGQGSRHGRGRGHGHGRGNGNGHGRSGEDS
jgi:hypothetical protein